MKQLIFFILILPFGALAQTEVPIFHDAPVEEVATEEAFSRSIPAHLKTGKPQYYSANHLAGYILNDSILIPLKYDQLDTRYSDCMIGREPKKLFGAINKKGETVIPFEFVTLGQHLPGVLFGWKKDAGYGLMTCSGKVLVPFEYKQGFVGADSVFVFVSPGKQLIAKVLDSESLKVLVEAAFEEISVEPTGRRPFFAAKQQGFWGIVDYQQRNMVPFEYERFGKGFDRQLVAVKGGKMGVVDLAGKVQVPFEYETIRERLKNGLFLFGTTVAPGRQGWGLVDSTGRVVAPAGSEQIEQFYNCDLIKVKKDGKWGILDPSGTLRAPHLFSTVSVWKHNVAAQKADPIGKIRISKEEQYGIYFVHRYTENGKIGLWQIDKGEIIAPAYDYFDILYPEGPIGVTLNDKRGLFSVQGKQLTGFEYDALGLSPAHPAYVSASIQGKRTLLSSSTGKPIQEEYYDDWYYFTMYDLDGYFSTKIGDFTALHAPDGRRLTPHKYKGSMTPCGPLPEVEAQLPKGRKIVACARADGELRFRFFALDNTGAEYEYTLK
ncbi:MAG: WG repeat-containing protein [Saprospiraceae bacterium]|nr:WG repeat-containing protein [Saprospiraceae bacterium]